LISLTGKPGDLICQIHFNVRPAFSKDPKAVDLRRDLVYGHVCPTCNNVIQACFLTDKPIDLWPYEETVFISQASGKNFGTTLKIVPNEESKAGYSQYTSTFERTLEGNAQHLVMKNHVLRYQGIDSKSRENDRYNESGGHTCAYTGCFSLRQATMLKDLCLFYRCDEEGRKGVVGTNSKIDQYEFTDLTAAVIESLRIEGIRTLPSYGQPLPMLLFGNENLKGAYSQFYKLTRALAVYRKEVKA
jgi:hypothetical protein